MSARAGRMKPSWSTASGLLAVALGVAACGSTLTPVSSSSATAPASIVTASPSAVAPSPSTASSSTASPAGSGVSVNLTFTGTTPFTAIGSGGRCTTIKYGSNQTGLGFDASEADYPGLGASFGVDVSDLPNIKWQLKGSTYYIGTKGLTLSADHHTITLDTALLGAVPAGATPPGPEHVRGTIVCP